jgi:hypothetical protein
MSSSAASLLNYDDICDFDTIDGQEYRLDWARTHSMGFYVKTAYITYVYHFLITMALCFTSR